MHQALDVGGHHPVVLIFGGVDERLGQLHTGIVDEDVQPAEIGDGLRPHLGRNGLADAASAAGDDSNPAAEIDRKRHAEAGIELLQSLETRAQTDNLKPCSDRTAFTLVGRPEKVEFASQALFPPGEWDRLSANLRRREEYLWPFSSC
jgi:hypothetical protein